MTSALLLLWNYELWKKSFLFLVAKYIGFLLLMVSYSSVCRFEVFRVASRHATFGNSKPSDLGVHVLGGPGMDAAALEKEFQRLDIEGSKASHAKDCKILLDEVGTRRIALYLVPQKCRS
jgi:hypothetical protein